MDNNSNTNPSSAQGGSVGFPQSDDTATSPALTPIDTQTSSDEGNITGAVLSPSDNQPTPNNPSQDVPSADSPIPQSLEPSVLETSEKGGQSSGGGSIGMSSKKILATILGLVLLVTGVATGVYLVGQQQRISTRALQCSNYIFSVNASGEVGIRNGSNQVQVGQQARVFINDQLVQTFQVPELQPGQAITLGTVTVPSGGFTWKVEGAVDCQTTGSISSGQSSTNCSEVMAYDNEWNELSASELSALTAGDTVRFAVTGTTNQGTFDAAKFTINGTVQPETTNKKPGTDEFYMDYVIPSGTLDFEVEGMIRHSILGWI